MLRHYEKYVLEFYRIQTLITPTKLYDDLVMYIKIEMT